jgi:[ribosomal protein S18]-alanine N-acetyltransferase
MRNLKDHDLQNNLPLYQTDSLRIERMVPSDLEEVMEIESLSFPSPWARSYFLHEIRNNRSAYPIVLRNLDNQKILGFAICWIFPDEVHITNVAVHPDFRKRGYGGLLVRTLLDLGRQNECSIAALEARVSNRSAIRLYISLGFRIGGVAPHYYDNNGEDAYILRREI